jgi:predicted transcriptional regulator
MANKVSTDKKEFAEALFMQNMAQNAIADKIGVSVNTISRWVKDGCWAEKRTAQTLTRKEVVNNVLRSVNALAEKLGECSDVNSSSRIADQLAKLSSTISKLDKESSVVDYVDCFIAFGRWLEYQAETDPEITIEFRKKVNKYQNKFITELFSSYKK